MFELKLKEEEKNGFIYKIMQMDLGDKKEEVYIRLPISEKEYLTNMYDPYVVFNIFKMMSIGGDCYIRGKVSKSLLDNLEIFVNYWKVWLPDKCKSINIIADEEIDDVPKKLNNDAILSFTGGLDSTSILYRHYKRLAGRNNKNIKKLISVTGARDISSARGVYDESYRDIYLRKSKRMISIAEDLGFDVTPIETNLYSTDTIFNWGDEFIALYVSIMMLYQDVYNNLLIANDEFILMDCISVPHASNPISNRFLQSNKFNLITDGEHLTRVDKLNIIKDWKVALVNLLTCDEAFTEKNMCCGICDKCVVTKFDLMASDVDIDFNLMFENPDVNFIPKNITPYKIGLLKEILYYNDINKTLDESSINQINLLINKFDKTKKVVEEFTFKIEEYKQKESIFNDTIDKIAWWIPIKKWRNHFKDKFKIK